MSLIVVGTVAYDSVETPTDKRDRIMGGSASYFSIAANFFTDVSLLAVVGGDMEQKYLDEFAKRGIDCSGLEIRKDEKSFYWSGKYMVNMNDRETKETQLNVLATFNPTLSEEAKKTPYLFLANGSCDLQLNVLKQWRGSGLCVADTMNLWIETQRPQLDELLKQINGLVLNDSEAIQLTGETNLVKAGRKVLELGPKFVVLKKGEHGVMFFSEKETYTLPAWPLEDVVDPTGAGDSFAGAMMGYLASQNNLDSDTIKMALAYATVVASFTCEDFSWNRLLDLDLDTINDRLEQFRNIVNF